MWRIILLFLGLVLLVVIVSVTVPAVAVQHYGQPSPNLSVTQVFQYSARLLWDDGLVTEPLDRNGREQPFTVQQGEPVDSITRRLQQAGDIQDAQAMRDYLAYTGLDTTIQAGNYKIGPAMSARDIAHLLQDATPTEVTFVVWPGWRIEEIAESLPTSGLDITPDEFVGAASSGHAGYDFLEGTGSTEGFLFPDSYVLSRTTTVDELLDKFLSNFSAHLTPDLRQGFKQQGLTVYEAVKLASIVQREAMHDSEGPLIASVYLNRLRTGMKLDADPTVQYALGYNALQRTWWTNPLTAIDLQVPSPYNTYLADGLPPTPISNPSLDALQAVAKPATSDYYYFNARCDGSGYHQFAHTFQEHLQHLCP